MGETGKRNRRNDGGENKNSRRRIERDDDGNDELVVYRILCPGNIIGSVIGKNGKIINAIRSDTRAKVKVVDPVHGAKDRVITIYCYVKEKENLDIDDEFGERKPLCPAQDALLRVHEAITNAVALQRESDNRKRNDNVDNRKQNDNVDMEECNLLVPSSQSANVIGKSGSTIKRLRSRTRTNIKIEPKNINDPAHSCALDFDNFILISGESVGVKRALFAVSAIMYKFAAKEGIPLDTKVPEALPNNIIIPPDAPVYPATGLYKSFDPVYSGRFVPSAVSSGHLSNYPGYGETLPLYPSALPVVSGYGSASHSEQLTVRVLCSSKKIGRVIGKAGSCIKSIRQASGAKIEADDTTADADYCLITVISTESSDDINSMAVEAVLQLQSKINDEDNDTVTMHLQVPKHSIGCIIGKNGSIIQEIRKRSNAKVRISKGEIPKCVGPSDEHIEITGEVSTVRDALIQIVVRLRDDVFEDKRGNRSHHAVSDPSYNGGASRSMTSGLPITPPSYHHSRPEAGSRIDVRSTSSLYGYGSHGSPPLRERETGYNSLSSYSSKYYGGLSAHAVEMVIPRPAVGKVLGKGGMNLENIRKISGAVVDVVESKSSRGDRLALISGTNEQKRTAEDLLKAFIMST